ncbi:hypothetical protein O3M35_008527 [Rhynocoris fuscipes]|uniref:Tetratricopeptide repeat protein n=1 Tax=Rhynocoris fuscipes TaxID=488301 RepID=A0AAW1D7V9_9HEMI
MRTFYNDVANWADEMKQIDEQLRNLKVGEEEEDERYEEEDNELEEIEEPDENSINQEKIANEYKEKGNELVKFGKWKEAIEFYDKAIQLNGNEAVYYGNRGYCYLQLNDLEQAELDCTQALNINSKYVKVLLRRALIRIKNDQLKDAAIDLDNLLQIDPNNITALKELNCIYPKLKELNYKIDLKTKINEINDNEEEKLKNTIAFSKSSTDEKESKISEIESNNNEVENSPLDNTNAANVVITKTEYYNKNNKNNKFYIEIKPYKSIPAHLRSRVSLKRITVEDVFVYLIKC